MIYANGVEVPCCICAFLCIASLSKVIRNYAFSLYRQTVNCRSYDLFAQIKKKYKLCIYNSYLIMETDCHSVNLVKAFVASRFNTSPPEIII